MMTIPVIHIIWPTARVAAMKKQVEQWVLRRLSVCRIHLDIAVNTSEELQEVIRMPMPPGLSAGLDRRGVIVTGTERLGPVWPVTQLCKQLVGRDGDIVILATDDFSPPEGWDQYILDRIGYPNICAALLVNDGIKTKDRLVALPIMTWSCFEKLNRLIVHPDYNWHYADAELYENLAALDLIRDVRDPGEPIFQHEHWTVGKRAKDTIDRIARRTHNQDKKTFKRRMAMSVAERIKEV